jgi:hypothetical protein
MSVELDPATLRIIKNASSVWAPQEGSQTLFVTGWHIDEMLYEGTRGPGKTNGLLLSFCAHVGRGFGEHWRGIIFRKTFPELKDIIGKSQQFIKPVWGESAQFNIGTSTWKWDTGETLIFAHFERDTDYWKYHGHEYPFIGWEELTTHATLTGYKRMFSCARAPRRDFPGVPYRMPVIVRATTNPYGAGHNVVKTRFRLPHSRSEVFKAPVDEDNPRSPTLTRCAIYGHISENKKLIEADPDYIFRVASAAKNPAEKKAWMTGSWDVTSGGMFDDLWQALYHVIDPFDIPDSWLKDRAFDWGSAKPFSVGWWAESNGEDVTLRNGKVMSTVKGDLFRFNEWYGWNGRENEGLGLVNSDITKGIIERELAMGMYGKIRKGVADSAIFSEGSNDGNDGQKSSIAADMAKAVKINGRMYPGIKWYPAAKGPGSRKNGWQKVRTKLKEALPPHARIPAERGVREQPGLFVFRNCTQFLRVFPGTPRDEKDLDDVNSDVEDHIQDETRYRVTWKRPVVGSGTREGGG